MSALFDRLREKQLARSREDWVKRYADKAATIYRRAVRKGKDASNAVQHKPITPPVKCEVLSKADGAQMDAGEQTVSTVSFYIRFAHDTDIRSTDQIEVDGERYAVVGDPDKGRSGAWFVQVAAVKL